MENLAITPYGSVSYLSTNNEIQNSNRESKEQFKSWHLLPNELIIKIFSFLPIKSLIHAGAACRTWKLCSDNDSIWDIFCRRINIQTEEPKKCIVLEEIKSLIECANKNTSESALLAHITLTKFGLSSLEKAFNSAKTIPITEEEKNLHLSSPFHASTFYDKCYSLAYAYLAENNFTKVKEIISNMLPSTQRGIIAFEAVKSYLKMSDLEKALWALRYIKPDQQESLPSLSLFIWKAKETNNIDIAIRALTEFSSFPICLSCAKDFNQFLMERGEEEKSKYLQTRYPQIKEENPSLKDVSYYAYNGQLETAIQKAHLFSGTYQIIQAFEQIQHIINNAAYLNACINGDLKEEKLNKVKSLINDLWNEFTQVKD